MTLSFVRSFQSEWLKKKRSAASWLVIVGGFFIPLIMLIAQFSMSGKLAAQYASPNFWESLFHRSWESMAIFLLPMGIILSTSLIAQLEFKNNAWKQVHTTPQQFSMVFFSKLVTVLIMMLQFFILFNIGIYLVGIIPALLLKNVNYPAEAFPFAYYLKANFLFYIDCLPIIAIQYLISIRYKNFLVSIGAGLVLVVASMFALHWEYGYTVPYTYATYTYLQMQDSRIRIPHGVNIHLLALCYFFGITVLNYILYITNKEKG